MISGYPRICWHFFLPQHPSATCTEHISAVVSRRGHPYRAIPASASYILVIENAHYILGQTKYISLCAGPCVCLLLKVVPKCEGPHAIVLLRHVGVWLKHVLRYPLVFTSSTPSNILCRVKLFAHR